MKGNWNGPSTDGCVRIWDFSSQYYCLHTNRTNRYAKKLKINKLSSWNRTPKNLLVRNFSNIMYQYHVSCMYVEASSFHFHCVELMKKYCNNATTPWRWVVQSGDWWHADNSSFCEFERNLKNLGTFKPWLPKQEASLLHDFTCNPLLLLIHDISQELHAANNAKVSHFSE